MRRLIAESAWTYQHKPWIGGWLAKRLPNLEPEIKDMSWKAPWRLHTRYKKLSARGKNEPQIVTAIGRELLAPIWAIAVRVEARQASRHVRPEPPAIARHSLPGFGVVSPPPVKASLRLAPLGLDGSHRRHSRIAL